MNEKKELVFFETEDNTIKLEVPVEKETVWLSQSQMTELFGVDRTVITRHVNNVFKEGELIKESNVQKMHIALFAQFLLPEDIIYMLGYNCPFPFEQFCYLPLCQPYGIVFESDLKLHLIVGLVQNDFSFLI